MTYLGMKAGTLVLSKEVWTAVDILRVGKAQGVNDVTAKMMKYGEVKCGVNVVRQTILKTG